MSKKFVLFFLIFSFYMELPAVTEQIFPKVIFVEPNDPLGILEWYKKHARKFAQSAALTNTHFISSGLSFDLRMNEYEMQKSNFERTFAAVLVFRFLIAIQLFKILNYKRRKVLLNVVKS